MTTLPLQHMIFWLAQGTEIHTLHRHLQSQAELNVLKQICYRRDASLGHAVADYGVAA